MPDFSINRKAQRLSIFIDESDRWRGFPLSMSLLEVFRSHGMAGATMFRGIAGFGAHSRIHTRSIEVLSFDLPVIIEVIDTPEKIKQITEVIYPMVREGLIIVEDVEVIKYTHRYLNPLPADLFVSEIMTRNVVLINKDISVFQAWRIMLKEAIKAVPVVDETTTVVGILTDEDLLERAGVQQRLSIALRMDPVDLVKEFHSLEDSPLLVADVMTKPVVTVFENDSLGVATAKLIKAGLKRLPVVDTDGKLVGIISRLDILRQVANVSLDEHLSQIHPKAARTVGDIMVGEIPMVSQDDDLATIVEKFSLSDSHRLIVVDHENKAIGLISDSDVIARVQPTKRQGILRAFRRKGKPPVGKESAYDLMSIGPLTAPPDLPVVDAIKKMLAESRKWLVVVDDQSKPLGMVDRQMLLESIFSFSENDAENPN